MSPVPRKPGRASRRAYLSRCANMRVSIPYPRAVPLPHVAASRARAGVQVSTYVSGIACPGAWALVYLAELVPQSPPVTTDPPAGGHGPALELVDDDDTPTPGTPVHGIVRIPVGRFDSRSVPVHVPHLSGGSLWDLQVACHGARIGRDWTRQRACTCATVLIPLDNP